MTVQNQNVKNVYRGNGSATVFPFTFAINKEHPEYIHVYITDDGGKAVETTDFTCDMDAKTITYPKPTSSAAKLSSTQRLTIYRLLPYTQELNLVNQGPFFAEDVETELDDLEMQIQQMSENLARCFQIGVEAVDFDMTMELEPDKVICVNSAGNGFEAREALMEVNGVWNGEGRRIVSVADPTSKGDAATKNYVDENINYVDDTFLKLQSDGKAWEGRGLPVSNIATPGKVKDATTKEYVDNLIDKLSVEADRYVVFNTVAAMKAADLPAGYNTRTLGYHDINDGGAGLYSIRGKVAGETDDGGSVIFLTNGNVAELLCDAFANVKCFGAYGDNDHDDTNAIQKAIDYISLIGGGTVYFPKGQYKISATINVNTSNVHLLGVDKYQAVIKPTEDLQIDVENLEVDWSILIKSNNPIITTTLSQKIVKYARTITVADATGIEAGMLVYIQGDFSTSPWTSENRGYIVKGETNKVLSVTGNVITLDIGLSDSFDLTEIVTLRFTKPLTNIRIEKLGVACPNNCPDDQRHYRGFCIQKCEGALINDCYGNGCGFSCFESIQSFNSKLCNNVVSNCWAYFPGTTTSNGLGYGLRCSDDNYSEIVNNTGNECRHCVDISGGYPSHRIKVANNSFISTISEYGVLSTHGSAENCIFENNKIYGSTAILIRSENITVKNNILHGAVRNYYGRNNTYENNIIINSGLTFFQEDTEENGNFTIIRNNYIFTQNAQVCFLAAGSKPFSTCHGWVIEGNVVIKLKKSTTASSIFFFNTDYSGSDNITFTNGLTFRNNIVRDAKGYTVYPLQITDTISKFIIGTSDFDNVITDEYVTVNPPNKPIKGTSIFRLRMHQPVWFDGSRWVGADGRLATAKSSSPPSSGDYIKGDIVWNSNPNPNTYLGWVCTAGGSPGTWKGFGLIET